MLQFLTVNYYSSKLINKLLISLKDLSISHKVIIVNNSPEDRDIHNLTYPSLEIIETDRNLGFGRACNLGLAKIYSRSVSDLVWLINPDAYFEKDDLLKIPVLLPMLSSYPILGTIIYDEKSNLTFNGGIFCPIRGIIREDKIISNENIRPTKWVSGCSLILNLQYFNECPNFDRDFFLYYEDFEFCQRYNKLGYDIVICSQIKVIHHTSSITSKLTNKLTQEIYSYLLALLKHSTKVSLVYRLLRIILVGIVETITLNNRGKAKLEGVKQFIQFYLEHSLGWKVQRDY